MSLKILIAPDKFKGTLTAQQAAAAIASGWRSARPDDLLELLPMSDGGDGFGEVLSALLGATRVQVPTVDAAHRAHQGAYWHDAKSGTIIIETAQIIGLALLPPRQFHPFELDTFGLGEIFRSAAERRPRSCVIGIGGSATNDGGFGFARALGWEFTGGDGPIEQWVNLDQLTSLRRPLHALPFQEVTIAVDVQNPLLGLEGATRIYGPQKGLTPADFPKAERALGRLASTWTTQFGSDPANDPGAGAAGGLGFGLKAFLGGTFESGFHIFARLARLTERLRDADLVLTGEGSMDISTSMGKGVGALAVVCQQAGVPVIGLAGQTNLTDATRLFLKTHGIVPWLGSFETVKNNPVGFLETLSAQAAREFTETRR